MRESEDTIAMVYSSPSEKTIDNSYSAAGVETHQPLTDDQKYLIDQLGKHLEDAIGRREVRALNRRFGVGPTTEALRSFVGQVRDGYQARNPFAVLWTITARSEG